MLELVTQASKVVPLKEEYVLVVEPEDLLKKNESISKPGGLSLEIESTNDPPEPVTN
jgi:hypothetical protein